MPILGFNRRFLMRSFPKFTRACVSAMRGSLLKWGAFQNWGLSGKIKVQRINDEGSTSPALGEPSFQNTAAATTRCRQSCIFSPASASGDCARVDNSETKTTSSKNIIGVILSFLSLRFFSFLTFLYAPLRPGA